MCRVYGLGFFQFYWSICCSGNLYLIGGGFVYCLKISEVDIVEEKLVNFFGEGKNVDVVGIEDWVVKKGLSVLDVYFDKFYVSRVEEQEFLSVIVYL